MKTRNNYVNVPMLVGQYPGEKIKFRFKENAVGIAVASGPDAGIIEYSIDNSEWKQQYLYLIWSHKLYLPWYYTLAAGLKGRTLNIQHDATSPSPHNLIHGVYGTEGSVLYDPAPPRICTGNHKWADKKTYDELIEKYKPGLLYKFEDFREGLGADLKSGHGGSDLINVWHIIDCLRSGLPLDQDVYDAAAFSSVVELSEWSVLNDSNSIKIPDFTVGAWKTNKPNMYINLENGSVDTKVLG